MSLKLHRPTSEGLVPSPVQEENWRRRLRVSRWRPAPLANPEATEVSPASGVLFFGGLAILTFLIIVGGSLIGLWG
ncbi:MAG TPA: hypothetical protein VIF84_06475 [Candidatus Limnocylindrales bacterium]